MRENDCLFCSPGWYRGAALVIKNDRCVYAWTRDPRDHPDVLPWCGVVVPIAHRPSPFDLSAEEWNATRDLLVAVRLELQERAAPDGYTLGWNDQASLHAHLHVIPRFEDEPLWAAGIRSAIKVDQNIRPDPAQTGKGRAVER